jgi:hypothetical protein
MHADVVLRIARPTDHLTAIAAMYATGLDFTVLAQFHDHDGSRPNVDTRLVQLPRKIICWCSIFLVRTSGKPVVPKCSQRGSNVSHPIIPIGKSRGRHLRILMGIESYSRMRRGPSKESDGNLWRCTPTADVLSLLSASSDLG